MISRQIVAALCKQQVQTLHNPEPEAPPTWRGRLARRSLGQGGSLGVGASLFLITSFPALAQLDTNANGMSNIWERHFNNGNLFDPANPDHAPNADPDGDGWTNLEESYAGTDPFSGNPPEGMVATYITHLKDLQEDPPNGPLIDRTIISWDTLPGKHYTLVASPDLTAAS